MISLETCQERNGHLEMFSFLQVIENSTHYFLIQTDILQKTVVECPCSEIDVTQSSILESTEERTDELSILKQVQVQILFFLAKIDRVSQ